MIISDFGYDSMNEASIPQNLYECVKPDPLAEKLRKIARGVEIAGLIIFCLIILLVLFQVIHICYLRVAFSTLVVCFLSSFIFGALSKIVNNTKMTAKLLEYQIRSAELNSNKAANGKPDLHQAAANIRQDDASWLCSSCNTRNTQGSVYCKSCGMKRG